MGNAPYSHLNLWKKRLGRVPDSVWERAELESLVQADNELAEVSEQIGGLKQLRMLDLGHNHLTWVPEPRRDRGADGFSVSARQPVELVARFSAKTDKVALPQHQRERFRGVSGMRFADGRLDRAAGIRQSNGGAPGFGWAVIDVAEAAPEKQQAGFVACIDREAGGTAAARPALGGVAGFPGMDRKPRGTRLRGLSLKRFL